MQLYVLSIAYLLFGAGILLADSYGLSFALLLSMRYAFRTKRALRRLLIILGMLITLGLGFFSHGPGTSFPWGFYSYAQYFLPYALLCIQVHERLGGRET